MNIAERLMVEEFNNLYPNRASLAIALKSSPTPAFREARRVTLFTNDEKVAYIKELRTREYLNQGRRLLSHDEVREYCQNMAVEDDCYMLNVLEAMSGLR